MPLANLLLKTLEPACQRIEIAGSLRRNAQASADIEIVAVPRITPRQRGLFAEVELPVEDETDLDRKLQGILAPEALAPGVWLEFDKLLARNGPRYKRLRIRTDGTVTSIPVDLFCVRAPSQWGPIMAIRTGPSEFSKLLVTGREHGGAMPSQLQMREGRLAIRASGLTHVANEESDFFEALGVPCWFPHERTPERLKEFLDKEVKRAGSLKEA